MLVISKVTFEPIINEIWQIQTGKFGKESGVPDSVEGFGKVNSIYYEYDVSVTGQHGGYGM